MRIFLDSSVIIATGLGLRSSGFSRLQEFARRKDIELITSQVVIAEVTNKFQQQLVEQLTSASNALHKLGRTVDQQFQLDVTDEYSSKKVRDFRDQLVSLFEDTGGWIMDHPEVPHDTLVKRSVRGVKPFGGKNDGYRDALIWFSVLEAVSDAKRDELELLYFGTSNSNDFSVKESTPPRLHQDLADDLLAREFLEDDVVLFVSLGDIIANQIAFLASELSTIQNRILNRLWKRGDFDSQVESAISSFIELRPDTLAEGQLWECDVEVQRSYIEEYRDARVSLVDRGFIHIEVDVICKINLAWGLHEDGEIPQYWSVESRETKWGTTLNSSISVFATASFLFDDQWGEYSIAVWLNDNNDMEIIAINS